MSGAETILRTLAARRQVAARIMVVVAHPDDETLGMGAQLCRLDDALLVHATDGAPRDGLDARRYGFADVADYAAGRRAELAAAMQAGGADQVRTLGLAIPDKDAFRDLAGLTGRIAGLLRAERPAAVFTHAYEGGHPDHDAAAFAVACACRLIKEPPAVIEMPLYHRRDGRLISGEFLPSLSRRRPGSTGPQIERCTSGSRPSPGGRVWLMAMDADEIDRKRRMIDSFATQRWLFEEFDLSTERFRVAPDYDFPAPPHPGTLHYETLGWEISGADWGSAASAALDRLGLQSAP